MRDFHWKTLERIAEHNPLEICWWDKNRRHKRERPDNLLVLSPMDVDLVRWLKDHADWIEEGKWSEETCSMPFYITAGPLQSHELLRTMDGCAQSL